MLKKKSKHDGMHGLADVRALQTLLNKVYIVSGLPQETKGRETWGLHCNTHP
jgi:hypothetical protein